MKISDTYMTISSVSQGIYRDKGSKFIAKAYPVNDLVEIRALIDETRKEYHDARHHCYAYILGREGSEWRANDDGEPSGSAGRPIMGQIRSFGLTGVLIIVTRYFGGTLLGVSGLIHAYKSAAGLSLENAEVVEHVINEYYEISFPYSVMNDIMRIIKEEEISQSDHSFTTGCLMKINFRESNSERILNRLSKIEGLEHRHLLTK